ncbi:DUF2497 domain-containing protein [Bartonella sp. F02]|uniref:DUF2497 domain-containing protein n=1 Tax=Bartonella sp. F02 TaxID=2967262 RepID=UPI0022A9DB2F|nr:DUF2497 domain-containing protein [Bartonella sp. F02]MCZ2328621.1 DUF2497 domain-containing protein [Bartonella sp. F02]
MVQSSNALREPSMDEILTSIREIIEENVVQTDRFSNEGVVVNTSENSSTELSEDTDGATLSVDDAMKALADRIGLSSEHQDLSLKRVNTNVETENNTVKMDRQNMKLSPTEQFSLHETEKTGERTFTSRQENITHDSLELSAYCISAAEKIAEDVLRPAIAEWLQCQLPIFLERILREEIVKAIKKIS